MKTLLGKVGSFFGSIVHAVGYATRAYKLLTSPVTQTLMVHLFRDLVTAVGDSEAAVQAGGFNFTVDLNAFNAIRQFIQDAKDGEPEITGDLKTLGVDFSNLESSAAEVAAPPAAPAAAVAAAAPLASGPSTPSTDAPLITGPGLHNVVAA